MAEYRYVVSDKLLHMAIGNYYFHFPRTSAVPFHEFVGIPHHTWVNFHYPNKLSVTKATYQKIELLAEQGLTSHTPTLFKAIDARYSDD